MAAYPSLAFLEGSAEEYLDGRSVRRATNLAAKARRLAPTDKRRLTLKHMLSDAERTTLETFYGTNKDLAIDVTWNGATLSCVFGAPARQYQWTEIGWDTTVIVEEV